jgi:DNA-binding HxlR family transcriptional regulator
MFEDEPTAGPVTADLSEPQAAQLRGRMGNRDAWSATRCSIDRAIRAIGNRATVLLLREAFYGTRRFDDFATRVGISEAAAAARLKELVELGVLQRQPYQRAGERTRYEYVLTPMGVDVLPISLALMEWGDRYLADPTGPPLTANHATCGGEVAVSVRCINGHEVPLDELSLAFTGDRSAD